MAVIQCTESPLSWSSVEKNFLYKVVLGLNNEISTVTVPLLSLVHPLCVIPDYGGDGTSYFVVLPRRNCSRYFGNRIKSYFFEFKCSNILACSSVNGRSLFFIPDGPLSTSTLVIKLILHSGNYKFHYIYYLA